MAKKKKLSYRFGTTITAVSLAVLVGIFISGMFRGDIVTSLRYTLIPLFSAAFIFWSVQKSRQVELLAYAVAILLATQASWDWYAHDWNELRLDIIIPAIISIVLNAVSGHVKLLGAKKTFFQQIGFTHN